MAIGADVLGRPEILVRIEEEQRARRRLFRGKFGAVWLVLVGGLVATLFVTGNITQEFYDKWGRYILEGSGLTIIICVSSIALATTLALAGAVGRLSRNVYAYSVASLYVSLVRGTPLLVQIFFVFFALPEVGIVLDALQAGILALGFNYGAYMTEIFRAGIQAVPRGQREAAEALGMPERHIMRRIVLPQGIRIVIPAVGNEFIAMIKDSALVSTISVTELLWRARRAGTQEFQTLQALLLAALIYWILTMIFSYFQERLERRLARSDR
jgi:polar amino acid transport system permease protein